MQPLGHAAADQPAAEARHVRINVNFEGGGECLVMDGGGTSEGVLTDIGAPALPGLRSPMVESVFEYGSRVGGWRLLKLFRRFGMKVCLLAVTREHIRLAFAAFERVCGTAPVGWMTGRPGANTRRLLVETGRLLYDRDALNDELPYWRAGSALP